MAKITNQRLLQLINEGKFSDNQLEEAAKAYHYEKGPLANRRKYLIGFLANHMNDEAKWEPPAPPAPTPAQTVTTNPTQPRGRNVISPTPRESRNYTPEEQLAHHERQAARLRQQLGLEQAGESQVVQAPQSPTPSTGDGGTAAAVTPTPSTPTKPATPTNVRAVAGEGEIQIVWAPSAGTDVYIVRRRKRGGSPDFVEVGATVLPTLFDTNVEVGATYWYLVIAENNEGQSAPSEIASATMPKPQQTHGQQHGGQDVSDPWNVISGFWHRFDTRKGRGH